MISIEINYEMIEKELMHCELEYVTNTEITLKLFFKHSDVSDYYTLFKNNIGEFLNINYVNSIP